MRNCVYIVSFTVIYLLKNCSPECTHYYLVLKEYFEDFGDGLKPMVEPSSMKTITHEYPSFNITNEFKELQDNKDCVLELVNPPTCMLSPTTFCSKLNKHSSKMGTDVHYTTTTADVTDTTRDVNRSTTEGTTLHYTTTDVTDTTRDVNRSMTEGTTLHYTTTDVTDTTRAFDSTSEKTVDTTTVTDKTSDFTTSTDDTTTVYVETTTETNGNAAELSTEAKKEVAKIVAISTLGATGTTALGYFIAMKIKHMLQYGAYHLTEPNPSLP